MATRQERMWQHVRADQALRQVRKQATPKHERESVRHRDFTADYASDPDSFDDLDLPGLERVMPRGAAERRRANLAAVMAGAPGPRPVPAATPVAEAGLRGLVVEVAQGLCQVRLPDGSALLCEPRRSRVSPAPGYANALAAGDDVVVSRDGSERGWVEAVLPRRSALLRPDPFYGHLQQVIVANVDQVLIVAAWREPAIWPELLDRYLIAAERSRLTPVICINKVDLAAVPSEPRQGLKPWTGLGYRTVFTSAATGEGVGELRELLAGRTTALAGLSGVGKSSLLAAIQPDLRLRTADVSHRRHEGRHTTTQVTLHPMTIGGYVADTPGIREFGLGGLHRAELARFYPEMAAVAGGCSFADCTHTREPGCAVRAAVHAGRIAAVRYDDYRKIYRDLPA